MKTPVPCSTVTIANTLAAFLFLATPMLQAQTGDANYFTEVAPGVVKDSHTGLEWMRCSWGQQWSAIAKKCTGKVQYFDWQAAQSIAANLNAASGYAGQADWRVPTVRELQTIRHCSRGLSSPKRDLLDGLTAVSSLCNNGSTKPAIHTVTFPTAPDAWFWTSTLHQADSLSAWRVSFSNGGIGSLSRNYELAVRLVR